MINNGTPYPIINVVNVDEANQKLPYSFGDCYYGHWQGSGSNPSGEYKDGDFFVAVYAPEWVKYEDWYYLKPEQLKQNTLFDGDPYLEEKLKCLSYIKHDKWVVISQTKEFIPPIKLQPLMPINFNVIEDAGIF